MGERQLSDTERILKEKLSRAPDGDAILDATFGSPEKRPGWAVVEIHDSAGLAAASFGRDAADAFTPVLFANWDGPPWQLYYRGWDKGVILAVAKSSEGNRRARELASSEGPPARDQSVARLLRSLPTVDPETIERICENSDGWLGRNSVPCTNARWRAGDKSALQTASAGALKSGYQATGWALSLLNDYGAEGIDALRELANEPYPYSREAIATLCKLGSRDAGQDVVAKAKSFNASIATYDGRLSACETSERAEIARFANGFITEEQAGLWALR